MTNKMDQHDYRIIMAKMDMVIDFLENHGGIGHEMYSFECAASHEDISVDIVDVALDIKDKIEWLNRDDDDFFPL